MAKRYPQWDASLAVVEATYLSVWNTLVAVARAVFRTPWIVTTASEIALRAEEMVTLIQRMRKTPIRMFHGPIKHILAGSCEDLFKTLMGILSYVSRL